MLRNKINLLVLVSSLLLSACGSSGVAPGRDVFFFGNKYLTFNVSTQEFISKTIKEAHLTLITKNPLEQTGWEEIGTAGNIYKKNDVFQLDVNFENRKVIDEPDLYAFKAFLLLNDGTQINAFGFIDDGETLLGSRIIEINFDF